MPNSSPSKRVKIAVMDGVFFGFEDKMNETHMENFEALMVALRNVVEKGQNLAKGLETDESLDSETREQVQTLAEQVKGMTVHLEKITTVIKKEKGATATE